MPLTEADINKTALLAKLSLATDAALNSKLKIDLNNILNLVSQIINIKTDHIQPMVHSHNVSQSLRPDKVTETNQRQELQDLVDPEYREAGLYLVPKVIEEAN